MITSMAQLDNCIEVANRQGDMMAVARMHAYVREAQLVSREEGSPLQEAALMKWRIPDWVPTEGHLSAKASDPNAPARVNTPQMMDSSEEWVRWMWRYPQELTTTPQDSSCMGQHLIVVCTRYADGFGEGTMRCQCTMHETHIHFMSHQIVGDSQNV